MRLKRETQNVEWIEPDCDARAFDEQFDRAFVDWPGVPDISQLAFYVVRFAFYVLR